MQEVRKLKKIIQSTPKIIVMPITRKKKKSNTILFMLVLVIVLILAVKFNVFTPYKIPYLGISKKILPHRVNTIEKLHMVKKMYNGAELDVVYMENKKYLDVHHPPEKPSGISLESYLKELGANTHFFLWLDLKNLNTKNADFVLHRISNLIEKQQLDKENFLIESKQCKALEIFTNSGFTTSYYLPNKLYQYNTEPLQEQLNAIKDSLKRYNLSAISTNFQDYKLIQQYFPTQPKYLWYLGVPSILKILQIRKATKDSTVKIILTRFSPIF